MAALTDEQWLQDQYLSKFGRTADTTSAGGAKYWLDQMAGDTTGHSRDKVAAMLAGSAEGLAYNDPNTGGVVRLGGVNRDDSTVKQKDNEYLKSIAGLGKNSADILNNIAGNTFTAGADGTASTDNVAGGYFQAADNDFYNLGSGGDTTDGGDTTGDTTATKGWWESFDDADAFKEFLTGDKEETKSDGMGDFMKFMMMMNVMGGGRGMGGGMGGGSQYGYGGLNPGGVMQAYDPMEQLTKMGTWFKDTWGSGSNLTMGPTHNDPAPQT
tara:strand:- start:811 stop:1617 length:807 start_codon:yes stop_codon:yes gene_type:complete